MYLGQGVFVVYVCGTGGVCFVYLWTGGVCGLCFMYLWTGGVLCLMYCVLCFTSRGEPLAVRAVLFGCSPKEARINLSAGLLNAQNKEYSELWVPR